MSDKLMTPEEEAWIEEAKRRMKRKEPGIPAEKVRVFRKLLVQEIKQTGRLSRAYADELLRKLTSGEL